MTEEEFLRNYDSNKFFKPSVTVDSILFTIRDVETTNYRKLRNCKFYWLKEQNTHILVNGVYQVLL